MAHIVASIDWYGPYKSPEEAKAKKLDYGEGLYMAIGRMKRQRKDRILYVGLSDNPASRVSSSHKSLNKITGKYEIWLGEISSIGKSGRKKGRRTTTVNLAESVLIYGLKPKLNDRKKRFPPTEEITILNRWWDIDYENEIEDRPHKGLPDIIDYRGDYCAIRLGWAEWHRKVLKEE